MRPRLREVVQGLIDEGTISSDDAPALRRSLAAAAANDTSAPWYVRLLAAFGAWVAAGLLLWFLAAAGLFKSGAAALPGGLVLLAAACVARARVRNDFAIQATLAIAVAGEALALFGAEDLWRPTEEHLALLALALNAAVVVALPDAVGRFLASAFAVACVVFLVLEHRGITVELATVGLAAAAVALWAAPVALGGARWHAIRQPLGVALVAGFLVTCALHLDRSPWRGHSDGAVTSAGMIALALALTAGLLREHGIPLRSEAAVVAALAVALLGAVGWRTPGILGAAMVLALGYHRREVVLVGLAVVFFVGFGAWYYYSLQLTLLEKSAVLILSGAVALGARAYLRRRMPA